MLNALLSLGLSEPFILHLFRLLAFAVVGAVLPAPLVSVTARVGLIALLGSVTMPVMAPEVDDLGDFLVALSAGGGRQLSGMILLQKVLTEIAIGMLLGVSLCLGFFVAALLGGWMRGLLPETGTKDYLGKAEDSGRSPVELALWCIYLLALFPLLQGFIAATSEALCFRSSGPVAIHEARALTHHLALEILPALGSVIWASAALLALPLLALSLLVDALVIFLARFGGEFFSEQIAGAVRLLVVVLLLGWVSLDIEAGITSVSEQATSADSIAVRGESLGPLVIQSDTRAIAAPGETERPSPNADGGDD